MQPDPRVQEQLEQRMAETAEQRKRVLENYASGDWLNIAPVSQMADRARRKGRPDIAQQLERHASTIRGPDADAADAGRAVPPPVATAPAGRRPLGGLAPSGIDELGQLVREQLIGDNEIIPARFVHKGSRAARGIGRIVTRLLKGPIGTGVMVSPRLLLTNHHVIESLADARAHMVQFGYLSRRDGTPTTPVEFDLEPDDFFLTSPVEELDFTLVAVSPVSDTGAALSDFGWSRLIGEPGKRQQGERVNIIHHPQGYPMQVSIRENFLALVLDDYLHYMTDTMRGSSGSPVYNDEWELVALHHGGREITDATEVERYRDIFVRHGPAGVDATGPVLVNEGARASRIVATLVSRAGEFHGARRALLDQALSSPIQPQDSDLPLYDHPPETPYYPGPQLAVAGGTATWTIPLTVTVGMGGYTAAAPAPPAPVTRPVDSRPASELKRELELYVNDLNSQKSILRALSFLQSSREGPYLPADDVIEQRKTDYYGDIVGEVEADNLDPAQLYDALHEIQSTRLKIATSFPESIGGLESLRQESAVVLESNAAYARSRAHLYTWADLHDHRMLQCVYTHVLISPEQLLLRDLLTQIGMGDSLPQRYQNNRFLNCEHIVPQSWFNHASVPRADMHHLITADGQANQFRSDMVYRQLDGQGQPGPDDRPAYLPAAGLEANRQFEPLRSKALVARATLYFLLTHKQMIDASKYSGDALETLKDWAGDAGPGDYERHRNEAIFEVQDNRNPLIDFPQWVDRIDFSRGLA